MIVLMFELISLLIELMLVLTLFGATEMQQAKRKKLSRPRREARQLLIHLQFVVIGAVLCLIVETTCTPPFDTPKLGAVYQRPIPMIILAALFFILSTVADRMLKEEVQSPRGTPLYTRDDERDLVATLAPEGDHDD